MVVIAIWATVSIAISTSYTSFTQRQQVLNDVKDIVSRLRYLQNTALSGTDYCSRTQPGLVLDSYFVAFGNEPGKSFANLQNNQYYIGVYCTSPVDQSSNSYYNDYDRFDEYYTINNARYTSISTVDPFGVTTTYPQLIIFFKSVAGGGVV